MDVGEDTMKEKVRDHFRNGQRRHLLRKQRSSQPDKQEENLERVSETRDRQCF